jgi:Zn-finger nucleic acid-binding protein
MKGAEALDSGNVKTGRKMDAKTEIDCPKCNVRMSELVDTDQHHIHLENCPNCKGTFLDAGEFRDLQHYTIADYVRGLFAKKKK